MTDEVDLTCVRRAQIALS